MDYSAWIVVLLVNLVAVLMILGKFPPRWYPTPNLQDRRGFYKTLGCVALSIEGLVLLLVVLGGQFTL
jgi:hypothetical protein